MSIYGELDEAPTRSPLMEDASNRRALEEAEREDTERPVRRAHTNQAHAIPQQGGYAPRGWPSWATGLCAAVAFVVLIAVVQAAFKPAPVAPAAMPEQAPAVAPASPWVAPTPPPLPTEAPVPAEQPVAVPAEEGANYLEPVNPARAPAAPAWSPPPQAAPAAPAERAPSDLVPLPDEAPPNPGLGSRPKPDTRNQP